MSLPTEGSKMLATRKPTLRQSHEAEYRSWSGIKQRCLNAGNPAYPKYGGRGIAVCERWHGDFEAFLADMGPRPGPGYSIDRIDNSRGYEPDNCRWATYFQQARNTRAT